MFFGLGQAAEGVNGATFALLLLFYYNQALGLSGSLTGLALLIAQSIDAVTDPVAGSISDNFRSRWGRRHPFMYASAIPLAITFYFLLSPPAGLGKMGLFLWLLLFAVAVRISMTLYHVPHLSLGAELTPDYLDRTTITSYRTFFSYIGIVGVVIVSFVVYFKPTYEYPQGQMNPEAYPFLAVMASCFMMGTIWLSAIGTHSEIPNLPQAEKNAPPFSLTRLFHDIVEALSSRSFRALFIGGLAVAIGNGLQYSLISYIGTFFWGLTTDQIGYIFVAVGCGSLLGAPLTRYLNNWIGKRATMLQGAILPPFFNLAPVALELLGWFPEAGDPWRFRLILFFAAMTTFAGVQSIITGGSLIADMVDEHELKSGKRQEGIFFGAQAFIGKATYGFGVVFSGMGLDLINFPAKAEPGAVAPGIVANLGLLYGLTPMIPATIALFFYYRISITRHSHAKTLKELQARRASRKE